MRTILFLLIFILTFAAHAQMQIGMRTGASYWPGSWDDEFIKFMPVTRHNELFTRLEGKRWAIEYGLDYYRRRSTDETVWIEFSGQGTNPYRIDILTHNIANILSLQYNITAHNKRVKNFVGVNLCVTASKSKSTGYELDDNNQVVYTSRYDDYPNYGVLFGALYCISYSLNEHWNINAVTQYNVNTAVFSSFSPATRQPYWYGGSKASLKLGVAYSFN
jgi:hypothetical protein